MTIVSEYLRPATLEEALACLDRPGAILVGGGTKLNAARPPDPVAVIDLQALHLDSIERDGEDGLMIGATVTLGRLAEDASVPAVIREAARREQPSTLSGMATVGGCVVTADPSSELLAALLVHGAKVSLVGRDGEHRLELAGLLAGSGPLAGRIITAVAIETGGVTFAARTGRTRADRPIVAAVARRAGGRAPRLALTGVAVAPVLVAPTPDAADDLDPPADFRGSSEYRRALAAVLARRALEAVG